MISYEISLGIQANYFKIKIRSSKWERIRDLKFPPPGKKNLSGDVRAFFLAKSVANVGYVKRDTLLISICIRIVWSCFLVKKDSFRKSY